MKHTSLFVAALVLGAACVSGQASYPGNGSDAAIVVSVNGVTQPTQPGVHVVSAGDVVSLAFTSPGGTLSGAPFAAAFQVFSTGSPPPAQPVLGIHFDAALPTVLIADGLANPGAILNPALGEFVAGGPVPPSVAGAGLSVLVNCVSLDVAYPLNLGLAAAQELQIQ